MKSLVLAFSGLLLIGNLSACSSSTQFLTTWQDPSVTFGRLHGEKVAAFLISDDEDSRRRIENALARELTERGAQGIAGHTLLSDEANRDEILAESELDKAGIQAVVTMRVTSEHEVVDSTAGTWHQTSGYESFGGSWVQGWGSVYDPGHAQVSTIVQVETLIYSMDSRKMIWAGLSETTDPENSDALVEELSAAIDDAIKKSGLLR